MSVNGERPAQGAAPGVPWYRNKGVLLGTAVAVIVAIAIVTDIPTAQSRSSNIAGADAFMREVNTDLAPCGYALTEAYGFRTDQLKGTLLPSERAQIPSLLAQDAVACSYANPSVSDLATGIESPGTTVADQLGETFALASRWVTYDALKAIQAIRALAADPSDQRAAASLATATALLKRDRTHARAWIARASRVLGAPLSEVNLPVAQLPSSPTG